LEQGDSKGAEKLLKDAQRYDAENREANTGWGLLQEQLGNYPEAIEAWEALLQSHPEEAAPVFRNLERVHFLDGSFSRMEQTYKRFLQSFPEHAGACFGLARFLRRKGQLDESLEICRRGLEARPDSLELQALSVALLLQSGRAAEAESQVDAWITRLVGDGTSATARRPSWITRSVAGDSR
jgi:tetratricopeptide (TPR) repeat protein